MDQQLVQLSQAVLRGGSQRGNQLTHLHLMHTNRPAAHNGYMYDKHSSEAWAFAKPSSSKVVVCSFSSTTSHVKGHLRY
jgi:hypothetical protein